MYQNSSMPPCISTFTQLRIFISYSRRGKGSLNPQRIETAQAHPLLLFVKLTPHG